MHYRYLGQRKIWWVGNGGWKYMQIAHSVLIFQGPKMPFFQGRIAKALWYHLEGFTELERGSLESRPDDHRGLSWSHSLGVTWSLSFAVEKGGGKGVGWTLHDSQTRSGGRRQLELGKPGLNYREGHLQMSQSLAWCLSPHSTPLLGPLWSKTDISPSSQEQRI